MNQEPIKTQREVIRDVAERLKGYNRHERRALNAKAKRALSTYAREDRTSRP